VRSAATLLQVVIDKMSCAAVRWKSLKAHAFLPPKPVSLAARSLALGATGLAIGLSAVANEPVIRERLESLRSMIVRGS
jgi:hypothetical protein